MFRRSLFAICAAGALLFSGAVHAVQATLEYELPTQYCDGRTIQPGDIAAMEIYVSAAPIPASDAPCPTGDAPVDPVPETFSTKIDAEPSSTSAVVDLIPGTYYVRARVQDQAGNWSNLSNQIEREIPEGPLSAPVLIRMQF